MDMEQNGAKPRVTWRWVLVGILVVLLIATSAVLLNQHLEEFKEFGYLGAFLISFLASATVITLVPSSLAVLTLSAWLNPFFLGLAAGAGEAIGEMVIYTAGRTGNAFFLKERFLQAQRNKESRGIYPRLQRWIRQGCPGVVPGGLCA